MSRFEETLQRDLRQIADRATPSPDAWAQIQSRIADQDPIEETEIIMLMEATTTRRRWPLVAAAAAVVALAVGGIALVNRGDDAEQPIDEPVPTVAPAPDPQGETDISELPLQGSGIAPGRYSVDTFGVPLSFEVPAGTTSPWAVQVNDDIAVTIGDDDGFVNMSRLGSFYDAAQAQDPEMSGLGSIAPNDIDTWIEANGLIVDDSQEVTVGGRSAQLRQVRAPDGAGQDSCPPEIQPCVRLSSASADQQGTYDLASSVVYGQFPHTFWIVELDDFEPLGIWVHTETPDTQAWLDEVAPLIESIEIGEPAAAIEGGTARLSTFGADEAASVEVRTVTLTGAFTSSYQLAYTDGGNGAASASETWSGQVEGTVEGNGNFRNSNAVSATGRTLNVLTGDVAGIGSGTLSYTFDWARVQTVEMSGEGTITGGTGDFADATGTVTTEQVVDILSDTSATGSGTYSIVLTLPDDRLEGIADTGDGTLELPRAGASLGAGRYASDSLGVPIEFDLDVGQTAPWTLLNDDPGRIWVISTDSDSEFMAIGRLGSWYDATEARTEDTTGLGSIAPDDIDGWIEQNGIIVVDSGDVEVGGRSAKYRQFRLDTTPGATADFCPSGGAPCLHAATGSPDVVGGTANPIPVGLDRVQSVWLVDMDEYEPVYIFAAANLDDDGPWFTDVVQPIVDSITFGEPAPTVEGGTARVPERVAVTETYSGVRTDGAPLGDGSVPITYRATTEGQMTGEIVGTGTYVVGSDGVTTGADEYTFTGTIDGIGNGTLTYLDEWTATGPTESTITNTIVGGTGDFAGVTGSGTTTVDTSEKVGAEDSISGTNSFDLAVPRTG